MGAAQCCASCGNTSTQELVECVAAQACIPAQKPAGAAAAAGSAAGAHPFEEEVEHCAAGAAGAVPGTAVADAVHAGAPCPAAGSSPRSEEAATSDRPPYRVPATVVAAATADAAPRACDEEKHSGCAKKAANSGVCAPQPMEARADATVHRREFVLPPSTGVAVQQIIPLPAEVRTAATTGALPSSERFKTAGESAALDMPSRAQARVQPAHPDLTQMPAHEPTTASAQTLAEAGAQVQANVEVPARVLAAQASADAPAVEMAEEGSREALTPVRTLTEPLADTPPKIPLPARLPAAVPFLAAAEVLSEEPANNLAEAPTEAPTKVSTKTPVKAPNSEVLAEAPAHALDQDPPPPAAKAPTEAATSPSVLETPDPPNSLLADQNGTLVGTSVGGTCEAALDFVGAPSAMLHSLTEVPTGAADAASDATEVPANVPAKAPASTRESTCAESGDTLTSLVMPCDLQAAEAAGDGEKNTDDPLSLSSPSLEDQAQDPSAELYAAFLERAAGVVKEAGITEQAAALFEAFQTTDDLGLSFATFARLYALAVGRAAPGDPAALHPPWAPSEEVPGRTWRYPYQPIQRLLGSNWKAQKLWRLLGERVGRPEYAEAPCSRGRLAGSRCLVIGAGPCGLRAAIELRLLGAQVTVVEQRVRFTRINQLHIWSWCGEDLKGLGARIIEPPPKDFGSNPDLLAISINDLQKLLLKVALLLGAEIRLGLEYGGVQREAGSWQALLRASSGSLGSEGRAGADPNGSLGPPGVLPPSQFVPGTLCNVAVVIGSGGFASTVGDEVGMRMLETDSLRKESAIGLICNVARTSGKAEADLRSYSLARQFYTAMFRNAAQETGADLENIVYVKAPTSHYFVMTPTPKSLIAAGVVINEAHKPLLARENISAEKLDELVRRVLSYRFKKGEPTVMEAVGKDLGGEGRFPGYADSGPRLFDFSKMRRSSEGLLFLPAADAPEASGEGSQLLVALAGDALIEPFWPEGLGIMRGFFSVLDACYAVQQWSNGATCTATQEVYQVAFQQLKTLSAATRARVLREDERKYALSPSTRYR